MQSNEFLLYLQYEKRYSAHTIKAYATDLQSFSDFLVEVYGEAHLEKANYLQVRSWVVSLLEQNFDAKSVNRKISCLKSFFSYLLKHNLVPLNPMQKVVSPKSAKKLPVFIEKEGMDVLLNNFEFEPNFEGNRDRLILEIFYCTGIRLSELINIKITDLDFSRGNLKVLGKRNKERIVPMIPRLIELCEKFIQDNHLKKSSSEYLITNSKGEKISPRLVYKIVNAYLSCVSTVEKRGPHILRHTFATHMLNNGADLNAIKELLGHASLQATQVYTHNSIEKLKRIHKQSHPRA
jgi:integrase/recombinase XerC